MEDKKAGKKSPLASIVSVVVVIVAFVGAKYLTQEGISAVRSGVSDHRTEQKVTNYFTDTSGWKDFNSTLASFKATFPAYPTHETTPFQIPGSDQSTNFEMYSAEQSDGTFYMVGYINYGSAIDTSVPENNLEGSVNGTVQSIDGTLISSSFSDFGAYRAVDYTIHKKDGTAYVKAKNILVGKSMYVIEAVYEPSNASNVQFDKFVNSFQLQ